MKAEESRNAFCSYGLLGQFRSISQAPFWGRFATRMFWFVFGVPLHTSLLYGSSSVAAVHQPRTCRPPEACPSRTICLRCARPFGIALPLVAIFYRSPVLVCCVCRLSCLVSALSVTYVHTRVAHSCTRLVRVFVYTNLEFVGLACPAASGAPGSQAGAGTDHREIGKGQRRR